MPTLRIAHALAAAALVLAVAAAPAGAYEILLDIDLDGDPATINGITLDTSCTVSVVLAPTAPGEVVEAVVFGIGGSCRECDGVHRYGVDFDFMFDAWPGNPDFEGIWEGITLLGCPAPVGFHNGYRLEPVGGPAVDVHPRRWSALKAAYR